MRGPVTSNPAVLNRFTDDKCFEVIGMIALGTGVAPMLCIIDYHLKNVGRDYKTDIPKVKMHLLYVNKSDKDAF
ncbi:hypothetical protein HK098_004518 [Nowakowskiella sp. JEL0407]|nr:hypothetical protein HK098_004518 [Nowakowskiella sp. JEL0407]